MEDVWRHKGVKWGYAERALMNGLRRMGGRVKEGLTIKCQGTRVEVTTTKNST